MEKTVTIHCDGSSHGNPGPSGIGSVIVLPTGKTVEISSFIGSATNNYAEYTALLASLKKIKEIIPSGELKELRCEIFMDSELVVKQLSGAYKIKNKNLQELYSQIQTLLGEYREYSLIHVPREQNRQADKLANNAIRAYLKNHENS